MRLRAHIVLLPVLGVACLLYLSLGILMTTTSVYDHDGELFLSDTAVAARSITTFHTGAHGDTATHPLFVMMVTPAGALLNRLGSMPRAIVILNTGVGGLALLAAYAAFSGLLGSRRAAALWALLSGSTATTLFVVSVPGRHLFAYATMALVGAACVRRPARLPAAIATALAAFGITLTNALAAGILFIAGHGDRRVPARARRRWPLRALALAGAVSAMAIGLALVQTRIWPETPPFFRPAAFAGEYASLSLPSGLGDWLSKAALLLAHVFCFNLLAPTPRVTLAGQHHTLMFGLESFGQYGAIGWLALAAWLALVAIAVWNACRRPRHWSWIALGVAVILVAGVGFHLVYGDCPFLYSVNWTFLVLLAVAAGLQSAPLPDRVRRVAAVLLAVTVAGTLWTNTGFVRGLVRYYGEDGPRFWRRSLPEQAARVEALDEALKRHRVRVLVAPWWTRWVAFPLAHRIPVVDIAEERSPWTMRLAELAPAGLAFLDEESAIDDFVGWTGGGCRRERVGGFRLTHSLRPPRGGLRPVTTLTAGALTDRSLGSGWRPDSAFALDATCELPLAETTTVCAVRAFSGEEAYPRRWRIDVQESPGGPWRPVTPVMHTPYWFWSGPRVYWCGRRFRLEARFPPVRAHALRIVLPARTRTRPVQLGELRVYAPAPAPPTEGTAEDDLLNALRALGVTRLYADRWIANRVHLRTARAVEVDIEPTALYRRRGQPPSRPSLQPIPMSFGAGSAILVREEDADTVREALAARGLPFDEGALPPWRCFIPNRERWQPGRHDGPTGLLWTGAGCFAE